MVKVILVSHGRFAAAIKDSCEMVIGKQEYIRAVCLDEQQGLRASRRNLRRPWQNWKRRIPFCASAISFLEVPLTELWKSWKGAKALFPIRL